MAGFTRHYLHASCEGIDAAMFSGDAFSEAENRERLRYYMARWEKQLAVEDRCATEEENPTPASKETP